MAAIPLAYLVAASTAVSVVGAISQGQTASQNAENSAAAADYNSRQGAVNAQAALETGNANEDAQRRRARLALGQSRAAVAESGLDASGSGGDVYRQSALNAEMDALNIRYGAQQQSSALKTQSLNDAQDSRIQSSNADNIATTGYLSAGSAALNGFSNYKTNKAMIAKYQS